MNDVLRKWSQSNIDEATNNGRGDEKRNRESVQKYE